MTEPGGIRAYAVAVGDALSGLERELDRAELAQSEFARLEAVRGARRELAAVWRALGVERPPVRASAIPEEHR